jgi:hypothetical protein
MKYFMNQRSIKKRLEKELSERCYQIGIPCVEEPKLCWNQETWKWYTGSHKYYGLQKLGVCHFRSNTILVDLRVHKFHKQYLGQLRDTLIHELVHLRWQKLHHGSYFDFKITEIKKGKKFPMRAESDMRKLSPLV